MADDAAGAGFTAIAVLSLALGIGATTAVFSFVDSLMFRDLPVRDPGQLVELLGNYPSEPRMNYYAWKVYEHYRDRNQVFSGAIGSSPSPLPDDRRGRERGRGERRVHGRDFFTALGVHPRSAG